MDKIKYDIKYNVILFLESLNPNEAELTYLTYKNLVEPNCKKRKIACQYQHFTTKAQLLYILEEVHKHEPRMFPIIHIACHGNEDGLKCLTEFIPWEELRSPFIKINERSKNHLYLIMAMCSGAFSISLNHEVIKPPYYLTIGPQSEISGKYLDEILYEFYKELFVSTNALKAVKAMMKYNGNQKIPFQIHTCIDMFLMVVKLIKDEVKSDKARHILLDGLKNKFGGKIPEKIKANFRYKDQILQVYKDYIPKMKKEFFLIDKFPENNERFESIKIKWDNI